MAVTNSTPQGHWLEHFLARKHRERRPTRPKQGLQVWHNTPGQYIECTCKLTTTKATRQNKDMALAGSSILGEQQPHASILSLSMLSA